MIKAGVILSIWKRYKVSYGTVVNVIGFFITLLILFSYYQDNIAPRHDLTAKDGVIDLTGWDFSNDGILQLDGDWKFFWQKQISPQNMNFFEANGSFPVPNKWKHYQVEGKPLPGDGYATYHLHLKLGKHKEHLAMIIPPIDTAYNLWVDGRLKAFAGIAGTDSYETKPQYMPQVLELRPYVTECDLVIQIANYSSDSGGLRSSILFGDSKQIHKVHEIRMALELCLFGILCIMAAYHFGLYRLIAKDKSAWYFGLFCLIIAIRTVVTGEMLVVQVFPKIDWEFLLKLDHISSYLGTLLFVKFIYYLYAQGQGQSKKFIYLLQFVLAILISVVIAAPFKIYIPTLMCYYAINVICIIYIVYVIAKAIKAHQHGAVSFACGSFVFLLTVINDMLVTEGVLHFGYLVPQGLCVFMFFQAVLLSTRFAGAFANLEVMSDELQISNRKINHILDSLNEGFFTVDRYLRITYINKKIEAVWQHPAADLLGHEVGDEVQDKIFGEQLLEAMRQNKELHFEFFSNDFGRWVEVNAYPFGEGLSVFLRDIQERKMDAAKLKEYAEQLREQLRLLDLDPEYTLGIDLNGKIIFWNQGAERGYGWSKEEVIGQDARKLLQTKYPQPLPDILEEVMHNGRWIGELVQAKKDGTEIIVRSCLLLRKDMFGRPESIREINNDITEQRTIEREMARLAQLNLIGQMAAGISHEVRNPMATVRGFLQLLARKKDCVQYEEYFKIMIEELDRANAIITEFLSVAKPKNIESSLQNMNPILTALWPLLQADALKSGHMVEYHLDDVPDLMLNGNEIRQMILNLARNGMEAMQRGGLLTISTYLEGEYVVMAVKDQGKGIDRAILAKLGTPFFTTKDGGTGLGLAVCYGIAARHKAIVDVETGDGGTTFFVRFKVDEA